ncbi:hypothetical protein BN7_5630 [Wickerhamomyces ciferrii]|uniref:Phosphatase PP2A regulatory subunit A/Splicing factor 3B subunit 1-like HEAT repeat domain-containing protein n=1 Tax=Wickerhamomyces ciferrii (strain ATCC 14091 / BCRC 22168 / CBS 111 / JCM 3599 / NBRC 0793 / NRRL Y-1031 F-60-10) TaxID=1206466 RepID=K0KVQ8_WICCF|nr:uncharacterized protein BN7_5630 [Wickerhamomyces ciferrii]CCH46042.1 hypothetical protein BN7_5630 [Wickerhamomyces ciferrii]
MAQESSDDIYPLALLMDELKHDDVANRVSAMQKLDTIALALGPERTRDELIPFLNEAAQDDEEEVYATLAEQLGDFVPFVGGSEYATILLPVLEILASTDEPIVSEKAVGSLNKVAQEFSIDQIKNSFLPLIENLSDANWFSRKVAACGLFESIITRVNDDIRYDLLNIYLKLTQDETPMVRRPAASHLPKIINLLNNSKDVKVNEKDWEILSECFQNLSNDNQDSVKLLSIDILIEISKYFHDRKDNSHNQELLKSSLKLIQDNSWRVRYMAADRFTSIAINFEDDQNNIDELIEPFSKLLIDNEGEVRKAIAKQLPGFGKLISKDVLLEKIIPQVEELSNDPSEFVRSSLASEITGLTPLLPKEVVIKNLLPIFLTMLKDEYPEVKLNIISKLKIVNEVIGIDLLAQSLLPAISELAKDKQWRVRLAIIEYIPLLAEQLGVSFFDEELGDLVLSWLWDSVYSIREAAVNNLEQLAKIFGSKWADEEIISRILKSDSNSLNNFVYRITSLFTLTRLIPVVDESIIIEKILPFIESLVSDHVANIRFNVAKSYLVISKTLLHKDESSKLSKKEQSEAIKFINEKIIPKIEILKKDNDTDVRYFANQSLNGINSLLESTEN